MQSCDLNATAGLRWTLMWAASSWTLPRCVFRLELFLFWSPVLAGASAARAPVIIRARTRLAKSEKTNLILFRCMGSPSLVGTTQDAGKDDGPRGVKVAHAPRGPSRIRMEGNGRFDYGFCT